MKKIYLKPNTETVVLKPINMIAGSPDIYDKYSDQPECSRRRNYDEWDDEEEDW